MKIKVTLSSVSVDSQFNNNKKEGFQSTPSHCGAQSACNYTTTATTATKRVKAHNNGTVDNNNESETSGGMEF